MKDLTKKEIAKSLKELLLEKSLDKMDLYSGRGSFETERFI